MRGRRVTHLRCVPLAAGPGVLRARARRRARAPGRKERTHRARAPGLVPPARRAVARAAPGGAREGHGTS